MDINWDQPWPEEEGQAELMNLHDYLLSCVVQEGARRILVAHERLVSVAVSTRRTGALLVASQLCSCAPTFNAKLYAASQTFDEARHVEVFNQYIQKRIGLMYPINTISIASSTKFSRTHRWDLKFIGMQIVIEGLALSAFNTTRETTPTRC